MADARVDDAAVGSAPEDTAEASGARASGEATADGAASAAVEHTVDERRLRAFAAGVGDVSAPLFDLDSPDGIVAHPIFPVVIEWPLVVAGPPGLGLDDDAVHAGLHVSHEIAWHRPIRPGDTLRTTGRIETLEQRSAGLLAVFVLLTTGPGGEPVVESRQGILYRGSTLPDGGSPAPATPDSTSPGSELRSEPPPDPEEHPAEPTDDVGAFRVEEADAVVYSECSGIWNPIHTDPRAARLAGLPRPVLHGTATLARVVSALVEARLEGDPTRVARLGCRFTAPLYPGDRATVAATDPRSPSGDHRALTFTARKDDGTVILDDGFIEVA
ncbi:MAG TPA: MaoC/PaaZ C-terminal domain-containing protein [Solirubrobacterales bacterium]